MQSHEAASTNGRPASRADPVGARSELDGLRSACRQQAHVIELLRAPVSTLHGRAAALEAENAELRAVNERVASHGGAGGRAHGEANGGGAFAVCLPLDARAPGAARIMVEGVRGRVPGSVLEDARLVVSELVTDSVRHSGASAGGVVVVRVQLTSAMLRLEVEVRGRGGVIAPQAPDLVGGGGFGSTLVQELSERWGLERVAAGGTRVWALLPRAPLIAAAERLRAPRSPRTENYAMGERPSAGGRPVGGAL